MNKEYVIGNALALVPVRSTAKINARKCSQTLILGPTSRPKLHDSKCSLQMAGASGSHGTVRPMCSGVIAILSSGL